MEVILGTTFDGAAAGNSFAGTPQVHPCRLSRDVPVAHTPQKISRHPRLNSVQASDFEASISQRCDHVRGKRGFPSRHSGPVAEKGLILKGKAAGTWWSDTSA